MERLFKLIAQEASVIDGYYDFLEGLGVRNDDAAPLIETLNKIITAKSDHLKAIIILCDAMTKGKPDADMAEFARTVLADYRERNRLIK